jgi:ABC-type Fe3+/spermidine/putrescine transport system ATPase subunit
MKPLLAVQGLSKSYDRAPALNDVSLTIGSGEFVCLLGPNGSGKSTLLKILAGVETKSGGTITYEGAPLTCSSPEQRELVMVWQSLALFPHMNVEDNVGFGLSVRKITGKVRSQRIESTLRKVGLAGYGRRKIHELSGGEQQRVALARALVLSPTVLLLDEPFGAIDVQLRSQLQALLREIHRTEGLTILMVTHDIPEALALAEKIVVMDAGKVQQIGTADEMLHQPQNAMVAKFMGQKNVFPGIVGSVCNDIVTVSTASGALKCQSADWIDTSLKVGDEVAYAVDASKVRAWSTGENVLQAAIESRCILGSLTLIHAVAPGVGAVCCEIYNAHSIASIVANDEITLAWDIADACVIPLSSHPRLQTAISTNPSQLVPM